MKKEEREGEEYHYLKKTNHHFLNTACAYVCATCPYAGEGACSFYGNGFCINMK